jgi:hypothetical protein
MAIPTARELRHHAIEIIDPEIDHPLLALLAEIIVVPGKGRKNGRTRLLTPDRRLRTADAEMGLVPFRQLGRIIGRKTARLCR